VLTKSDGVEILMPEQVPEGTNVLMAMAPSVAESLMNRLIALPLQFIVLPPVTGCLTH
jgi:hypothetical protein